LVEVADFCSPAAVLIHVEAEAEEGAVLVEAGFGAPVGVVQVVEDFIPADEADVRIGGQFALQADLLSEAEAGVVAGFQEPLFQTRAERKLPGVVFLGPGPLLPQAVLFEGRAGDRLGVDPGITGPEG
jgi:hypothetical protein